ncbi:hypothetical protein CC1G_02235 [Coprinopsis cinerea okayama7|uniref:Uncharacterized protein n=1 Tax=Coprinopsis cinerea (strain Okayama-7 / 130 / ATCC MYA-4618 / FGSC 9003) TaxID=240176 RepID=A8NKN3_COPC7|nr:hypothetical protein CC1G_02235 [Coprinopsis cinerea okayama7\|eukprot:XP_001834499.2 hypothetical protein CC1G_02235 [Coprinopsis cinerea okayama7\
MNAQHLPIPPPVTETFSSPSRSSGRYLPGLGITLDRESPPTDVVNFPSYSYGRVNYVPSVSSQSPGLEYVDPDPATMGSVASPPPSTASRTNSSDSSCSSTRAVKSNSPLDILAADDRQEELDPSEIHHLEYSHAMYRRLEKNALNYATSTGPEVPYRASPEFCEKQELEYAKDLKRRLNDQPLPALLTFAEGYGLPGTVVGQDNDPVRNRGSSNVFGPGSAHQPDIVRVPGPLSQSRFNPFESDPCPLQLGRPSNPRQAIRSTVPQANALTEGRGQNFRGAPGQSGTQLAQILSLGSTPPLETQELPRRKRVHWTSPLAETRYLPPSGY